MGNFKASPENQPVDVEALIEEIRKNIKSAEHKEPKEKTSKDEITLYDELKTVSNTFSGGHWPSGGIIALSRKVIYRMLGLKDLNGHLLSILTRIISLIDGTHVAESSVILTNQRRTMELLTQLARRLDKYEEEKISERLSALENEFRRNQASEKQ